MLGMCNAISAATAYLCLRDAGLGRQPSTSPATARVSPSMELSRVAMTCCCWMEQWFSMLSMTGYGLRANKQSRRCAKVASARQRPRKGVTDSVQLIWR
jgi:hypothetical protein